MRRWCARRCAPLGEVYVEGALWQAQADNGRADVGDTVIVRGVDGLLLHVEPAPADVHSNRGSSPVIALIVVAVIIVFFLVILANAVKVLREYERGVVFRLGRLLGAPKGPGLFLLIPIVDKHGPGRPAHGHAGRPAAGRHHQGQRAGAR